MIFPLILGLLFSTISLNSWSYCVFSDAKGIDRELTFLSEQIPDMKKFKKGLINLLRDCGELIENLKLDKCLENSIYLQNLYSYKQGTYSPFQSDSMYLSSQPKDVVQLPIEFKNGFPKDWKSLFKKNKWKWHFFTSHEARKGQKGILNKRLVVRVIKEKVDTYLLFVTATGNPIDSEALQAIFIEKDYQGKNLKGPRFHFRTYEIGSEDKKTKLEKNSTGGRCIECHQNGAREIIPVAGDFYLEDKTTSRGPQNQFSDTPGKENEERLKMNELISSYGVPNWDTLLPRDRHFQGMKLGESASCTDCHNGTDRSILIPGISQQNIMDVPLGIYDKVIHHQTMPPDAELSEKSRVEMINQIRNEYHQKLRKWLTETPCSESND